MEQARHKGPSEKTPHFTIGKKKCSAKGKRSGRGGLGKKKKNFLPPELNPGMHAKGIKLRGEKRPGDPEEEL